LKNPIVKIINLRAADWLFRAFYDFRIRCSTILLFLMQTLELIIIFGYLIGVTLFGLQFVTERKFIVFTGK